MTEHEDKEDRYKVLGKSELLAAEDRRFENILVPEWKGYVRIQSLSADEGLDLMAKLQQDAKLGMILCLIKSAVDDEGNLLFTDDESAILQLKSKALSGFSIVQDEVMILNRLGTRSKNALEETKND